MQQRCASLGARFILLFACSWLVSMPLVQASLSRTGAQQQWVLQLGYFSHMENALKLKQTLIQAGFDVQVLATDQSGEPYYRVISMAVSDRSALAVLRDDIAQATGIRGILKQGLLDYTPPEELASAPGFTAGGLQIVPTIGLSISYDDNVTLAPSHEISSLFYQISPALRVELPSDLWVLSLIGAAEIVRYKDSPIDDNVYWYLRAEWAWDISTRQDLNLFAQYSEGSDRRGKGRRRGAIGLIPLDPDEWELWKMGGEWDYGAVGTRGRLTLLGGASDLGYTNNRGGINGSIGTRGLDRDTWFYGGTFYWRVAPKTSLLLDYRYTDISYALSDDFDSAERSWMAGVTWDASARTSGTIKYGYLSKNFDHPLRSDYSGPTWGLSVAWRPRSYSVFTLSGTRNTQEPDGGGDYVLRQDITLSWVHNWATRFATTVDVGFSEDQYRPTGNNDELFYWGIAARYTFNTYFRFGASITRYSRDSTQSQFDYDRRVYTLSLETTY